MRSLAILMALAFLCNSCMTPVRYVIPTEVALSAMQKPLPAVSKQVVDAKLITKDGKNYVLVSARTDEYQVVETSRVMEKQNMITTEPRSGVEMAQYFAWGGIGTLVVGGVVTGLAMSKSASPKEVNRSDGFGNTFKTNDYAEAQQRNTYLMIGVPISLLGAAVGGTGVYGWSQSGKSVERGAQRTDTSRKETFARSKPIAGEMITVVTPYSKTSKALSQDGTAEIELTGKWIALYSPSALVEMADGFVVPVLMPKEEEKKRFDDAAEKAISNLRVDAFQREFPVADQFELFVADRLARLQMDAVQSLFLGPLGLSKTIEDKSSSGDYQGDIETATRTFSDIYTWQGNTVYLYKGMTGNLGVYAGQYVDEVGLHHWSSARGEIEEGLAYEYPKRVGHKFTKRNRDGSDSTYVWKKHLETFSTRAGNFEDCWVVQELTSEFKTEVTYCRNVGFVFERMTKGKFSSTKEVVRLSGNPKGRAR